MTASDVIETRDLTKRYGRFEAVRKLNLKVGAGRITGFLGRNGAGKSSTIKMLLGISRPSSGTAFLLGRNIENSAQCCESRRHVAYVAEDKQTYGYMTVAQMIAFTRSFYADWDVNVERRLLKQFDLPPQRKVKALSKGMRTKLALLLALARRSMLLILDEPSEGLDPVSIEELLQALVAAATEGTAIFSPPIRSLKWSTADHAHHRSRATVADTSLDDMSALSPHHLWFSTEPPRIDLPANEVPSVPTGVRSLSWRRETRMPLSSAGAVWERHPSKQLR
jgi:ABC-2 type transport system ATP-binding protein